jgi:hypothetical protein
MSDFGLGFLLGLAVGVGVAGGLSFALRRAAEGREGETPAPPDATPRPREAPAVAPDLLDEVITESRIATREDEAKRLRQELRARMLHDEEKVERAVAAERERAPTASEVELLRAALYRWERDNR